MVRHYNSMDEDEFEKFMLVAKKRAEDTNLVIITDENRGYRRFKNSTTIECNFCYLNLDKFTPPGCPFQLEREILQ